MAVRVVWAGGEVGRAGESNTRAIDDVLTRAAECCDAQVDPGGSGRADPDADADGDPTEVAILAAAEAARPGSEGGRAERLGEVPFDAEARRMTVLLRAGQGARSVMKGAPDTVLARCRWLRRPDGTDVALTASERAAVAAAVEGMAAGALRVLAVAERPGLTVRAPVAAWEREMVFVGLIGMMDQPRPEASGALARCREAGIRVVMFTGDHPRTAEAVAREVGLLDGGARVVSGPELATWDDRRLAREIPALRVLARATPPDKLRVVRALRARGEVVAMTGDGVNDAPAVKEADIGVAMGRTGTDVTKEAAAVVLADDNFATIVAAVEEGRSIYDNVRKFIRYLLACNTGEVLTMFLVALIGAPMPLLPIQILWVNLVTDGLPALALGLEPADPEGMRRPPRPPHESVFARGLGRRIVVRGLVIGTVTVALFLFALRTGHRLDYARTLAFAALTLEQLVFVFECRSESRHPWRLPLARNPWLPLAALSSLALFLLTVYVPALRPIFATVPLGATGWLLVALAALGPTIVQGLRLGGVPRTRAVRA
jgi:Ca2+-transporting ATPase